MPAPKSKSVKFKEGSVPAFVKKVQIESGGNLFVIFQPLID